jgi:hypothetical protein
MWHNFNISSFEYFAPMTSSQDRIMTKIRWILLIAIICMALLVAGYRLTQPEPEMVAAASVPPASVQVKTESLNVQATTMEEVDARGGSRIAPERALFMSQASGYHLSRPVGWQTVNLSTTMTVIKSPDGASIVKVEAVGPLPADGLAAFVDRSLGNDVVFSRQLLTVHGQPAERVVAYSDRANGQVTTFYIDAKGSVFIIAGVGHQKDIELIARSFNEPLELALR